MNPLLAAIDLGTNTVRLLVARPKPGGGIEPVLVKRHITRLGGGFTREAGIAPDARQRTLEALRDFAGHLRRLGVDRVRAVATSAVRDAANREAFCNEVLEETGIEMDVIDGHEEGVLTLHGVRAAVDDPAEHLFVFDVGGGSTEFTLSHDVQVLFTESLPLGVVRLTEGKSSPDEMEDKIERELERVHRSLSMKGLLPRLSGAALVGTAGTATTLAAISRGMTSYDYRLVNNYVLPRKEVGRIYDLLLPLSPQERLAVPGLEPGREDLIIAGVLITMKTMDRFGFDRFKVSDFGLLEGALRSIVSL